LGAPLGNNPGKPLGESLGETLGVLRKPLGGHLRKPLVDPPGKPLEEPLGGPHRPTAGDSRTQQSLVRRRKGVKACLALPITLLAQTGSKSSTTCGTQHQRTQGQTHSTQNRQGCDSGGSGGVLGMQGGKRGRPPWGSPRGRGAGVHPGCLPKDRQGSTRLEGSTRDCVAILPLQHLNSHSGS
jgi:hypothetical protein